MEHLYVTKVERIARWVRKVLIYKDDNADCPAVGYLGYANGMSEAEWLAVNLAEELLTKQAKNWQDYFDYKVDSSG